MQANHTGAHLRASEYLSEGDMVAPFTNFAAYIGLSGVINPDRRMTSGYLDPDNCTNGLFSPCCRHSRVAG